MPGPESRRWALEAVELPDGRVAVGGLPLDRDERLSLCMRLCDTLRAQVHEDDTGHLGLGTLWRRYCLASWRRGWSRDVTVTLQEARIRMERQEHPA